MLINKRNEHLVSGFYDFGRHCSHDCNIERNLECQSDAFPPQIDTDKAKKVDLSNETEVQ